MEQEAKLCDEVETVRELTYLGDRVSASGRCEVAVTAGTVRWKFYIVHGSMERAICGAQLKDPW